MRELKFAQVVKLGGGGGPGGGPTVTISPHPAGHTVGGCFWRVSAGAEDVLYCPEYNHQREKHLPAGGLDAVLGRSDARPTLLIAAARSALVGAEKAAPRA